MRTLLRASALLLVCCAPEAGDDAGPDPHESVCGLENLQSSVELHLDGVPCDPCPVSPELRVVARLETDCPTGVAWEESCIILVDHLVWRTGPYWDERHAYIVDVCALAVWHPEVWPDAPLDYNLGPLWAITESPVLPERYAFDTYFIRDEIPPAHDSIQVGP